MKITKRSNWILPAALTLTALSAGAVVASTSNNPGAAAGSIVDLADRMAQEAICAAATPENPCSLTSALAARASIRGAQADLDLAVAAGVNLTDPAEAQECLDEALDAFEERLGEILEQTEARQTLCALMGEEAYDPEVEVEDFQAEIDNPLLPYTVGSSWTYQSDTEEGLEVITVTVLSDTKEIMGVECAVVQDSATLDGVLIEDTLDYYAQDDDGNVWYFGELSLSYEDGEISGLEGSWEAGEDGAKPGIVMYASPVVGTTYRQEWLLNEAEDVGMILDLDVSVDVPYGSFMGCLQTEDGTALEPDAIEYKSYAPGVGLVLEEDPESGDRVELIAYTPGS